MGYSADGTGYYQLVDFNVVCQDTQTWGTNGDYYHGGAYQLPDVGTNANCRNVYTYMWVANSGGLLPDTGTPGSPGFPSGPPPGVTNPYKPLPTTLPPPDTTCILTNESAPGLTGATPMSSVRMQQALFSLADQAAHNTPPNEMGGVIVRHQNGAYDFIPRTADPNRSSPCMYYPLAGYPFNSAGGDSTIAYVHTHPTPNVAVTCPELGPTPRMPVQGPSDSDMVVVGSLHAQGIANRSYIADPTSIYAIDGNTNAVNVWARPSTTTACMRPNN